MAFGYVGAALSAAVAKKNKRLALGIPRAQCVPCGGTGKLTPGGGSERPCGVCFGRGYKFIGPDAPSGSWFEGPYSIRNKRKPVFSNFMGPRLPVAEPEDLPDEPEDLPDELL